MNDVLVGFSLQGKDYFYIRDITGNINEIVDKDGTIMVKYSYDAWGVPNRTIGADLNHQQQEETEFLMYMNPFMYKGYYYDVETSLYYCNSRYYNPELGRWLNADDVSFLDPESINGLNLYAYCYNNPIMYIDPTGHSPLGDAFKAFGSILAVGGGFILCFVPVAQAVGVGLMFIGASGLVGGIISSSNGGSFGDGWNVGTLLSCALVLTIAGFGVSGGALSYLGSTMVTYGSSVMANMIEAGVTQSKYSVSKGGGAWDNVFKAMNANSGDILLGNPTIGPITILGSRMLSKIPMIGELLLTADIDKFFSGTPFAVSASAFLASRASIPGLALGYGLTAMQLASLGTAIFSTPDFENSR